MILVRVVFFVFHYSLVVMTYYFDKSNIFFEGHRGDYSPPEYIPFKVALRLCSLYKIVSNEPDYTGITIGGEIKRKTHTHETLRNSEQVTR